MSPSLAIQLSAQLATLTKRNTQKRKRNSTKFLFKCVYPFTDHSIWAGSGLRDLPGAFLVLLEDEATTDNPPCVRRSYRTEYKANWRTAVPPLPALKYQVKNEIRHKISLNFSISLSVGSDNEKTFRSQDVSEILPKLFFTHLFASH